VTAGLALGDPVRTRPWPRWPQYGERDTELLGGAVEAGIGSAADGPLKVEFEERWAEYTGCRHALGVSNGSISLQIALRALGIGCGDEVIVPPYTFIATATAVLAADALPVFVDIEPDTYNIDPAAVEASITGRTRAVIAVHLGGAPADLDALTEVCGRHGLALIEDAAHAHGARWRGQRIGGFGSFGSWSFQASKNLSGGEGGALTTDDERLAETAWSLHNCGRRRGEPWFAHFELGHNHRLTEWSSAVLLAGLERLPGQVTRREASASYLDRDLSTIDGIRPLGRHPGVDVHAHHLYLFRYDPTAFAGLDRNGFVAALRHHGIPASAGYEEPLYRQLVFAEARFDRRATGWTPENPATRYDELRLPVCERACAETVWLPHSLLLAPPEEMADVVAAVRAVRDSVTGGAA
jgi:dTDP-4-amino-4,6-dideoxygalactose transaminase